MYIRIFYIYIYLTFYNSQFFESHQIYYYFFKIIVKIVSPKVNLLLESILLINL